MIGRKDMFIPPHHETNRRSKKLRSMRLLRLANSSKVLELLRPGSFVTLENQPYDLPPFEVIKCKGGRCLVRQQSWGQYVQWEVAQGQLKSA